MHLRRIGEKIVKGKNELFGIFQNLKHHLEFSRHYEKLSNKKKFLPKNLRIDQIKSTLTGERDDISSPCKKSSLRN
jgi:hypothetical protein